MVASNLVSIFASLLLLNQGSDAASVYADTRLDNSRLVRKEAKLITESLTKPELKEKVDERSQFCHWDFVLGEDDSNECKNDATHKLHYSDFPDSNVSIDMCVKAAELSGARMLGVNAGFKVGPNYQHSHPKGCFKKVQGSETWYYYNTNGDTAWPNETSVIDGTPICGRNMYVEGTPGSHEGCPDGYQVVMKENACEEMANCLSKVPSVGGFQRIGLSPHIEKKKLYPVGCFMASSDSELESGKIYYNAPSDLGKPNEGSLKGTPMCNVTTTLSW